MQDGSPPRPRPAPALWLRRGASALVVGAFGLALVLLVAVLRAEAEVPDAGDPSRAGTTPVAEGFEPGRRAAAWLEAAAHPTVEVDLPAARRRDGGPPLGAAVGTLRWLGHEHTVVEGTGVQQLRAGPGHYPATPLPGHGGNVAIAGHRTTHGAPFGELDRLEPGDVVTFETDRAYSYVVVTKILVAPDEVWVAGRDPLSNARPTLTLTTCHPKGSARKRLVVFASLSEGEA